MEGLGRCLQVVAALALCVLSLPGCWGSINTNPVVCMSDGRVRGIFARDGVGGRYSAFWGIPYARPPVGELRFANPQPVEPWTGEYNVSVPKDSCLQKVSLVPSSPLLGTEDCLYLNVFVPKRTQGLLPVMVYIHGGGYVYGTAQREQRDPARFMTSWRMIIVTLQYRLGVLGFLSTGDRAAPGNFGMKDQTLALRWVQRNIRAFGGDPQRVTIFGESAGGSAVQLHLLSPLSRGLFYRAISMSGNALASWSIPAGDSLTQARSQAKAVGIQQADSLSTEDLVERLREVDAAVLVTSAETNKVWDVHPITVYHPVVESPDAPDPFLTEDPRVAWARGAYADVPWMTGTIPTDGSILTQLIYRNASVMKDLNSKFTLFLSSELETNITDAKLRSLRDRFLKTTPASKWVTKDNYAEFTQIFTEGGFTYPMVKSIKQHLDNRKKAPIVLYSFRFRGRYSFSSIFTGSTVDYGLSHPDDLIYLFRMPLFFPEFPTGSPEAEMVKLWMKFVVDFATRETIDEEDTCGRKRCLAVTFANTSNRYFPVSRTLVPGLDEKMYSFWRRFFDESG